MASFAELKRNREKVFQELNKQIQNEAKGGRQKDDRFWYPSVDQTGNGFAIIRFLPAPGDEPSPYVRMWSYGFKDRNGWYIENSRTTLGMDEHDPVQESNKALRADGTKASKAIADRRKASQSFFSNILVIRDPSNPENEGKVFLFRYGKKIHDRILAKMNPEFEGETKMNPFDMWEGANFRMKIKTEGKTADNPKGFRNYDSSEWDQPGPVDESDAKMEKIWKQTYSLQDLIAPDKFKTYEELKARFEQVTGERSANRDAPVGSRSAPEERSAPSTAERFANSRSTETPEEDSQPAPWQDDQAADTTAQDDDDLEFYRNLIDKS
jgi:hypothetical protein